jgi:hypothetical protein
MDDNLNSIVKNFNETLNMFVSFLRTIKNNDKDLLSLQTAIYGLNKVNYKACIEQFIILVVLDHGDKIIQHDYKYFKNLDVDFSQDKEKSMMKLLKFKEYSKELNDNSKNNIFDYLELMVVLARDYLKIKYLK